MGITMAPTKLAFGVEPARHKYRLRLSRYQGLAEAQSIIAHSVKTTMAAPLLGREGTHGALYIDNLSRRDRYAEDDLELLSGFAGQAAIAMENAMLHERLAQETATRQGLLRFFPKTAVATLMSSGMSSGSSRLAIIETRWKCTSPNGAWTTAASWGKTRSRKPSGCI